jgi:opacity protein-like surface antigen
MKMFKKREFTVFGMIMMLVSCWNSSSEAIRIGNQSQFNPFFEVQETYDSNIFRVNEESPYKESDFLTVLSPGIHLEFPTTENALYQMLGNYRANIKFYGANGDAKLDPNEELNTIEHRFDAQLKLKLVSGLSFGTGYVLNRSSTAPDFPGDVREPYVEQNIFANVGYQFIDRYEVQVEYRGIFWAFEKSDALNSTDYSTHRLDGTFFYRLFPSLSLLGGAGYAMTNREEPFFSDSTEYRGFGGVRFDATSRLTGTVRAGMAARRYDADDIEDATEIFVSGEVVSELFEQTKLVVQVQREIVESTLFDASIASGQYYLSTRLGASLKHQLAALPKLSLSGSISAQWRGYPEDAQDRSDTVFEAGAGVEYKLLKYLSLGVNYAHSQNDSNVNEEDYNVDRATFLLRLLL